MSVIAPLSLHSLSTMSKDNMLLGYARGKVGSLVFARRAGQQITRAYNANPANPRSTGQMSQRMLMSTAIQAYKFMSSICDHSFEDAVGKNGNMRAFRSAALRDLKATPANFGFQRYGERKLIVGPFQLSAGSLGSIPAPVLSGSGLTGIFATLGTHNESSISVKSLCEKIGLYKVGDMVTIPIVYPNLLTGAGFSFVRLRLIATPTGTIEAPGVVENTVIAVESPIGTGVSSRISFSEGETAGVYSILFKINYLPAQVPSVSVDYYGVAAIRSRLEDGKWLRSESFLTLGSGFVPAPTYDEALATYPQTSAPILDGGQV